MKKIFPLMFVLVFANNVFAVEPEVVAQDVANAIIAAEAVVTDEATKAEVAVVVDKLKKDGLTEAQILAAVDEKLCDNTTENAYRSILDKNNQEKYVWMLVGAVAGILVFEGGKWAWTDYNTAKPVVGGTGGDENKKTGSSTDSSASGSVIGSTSSDADAKLGDSQSASGTLPSAPAVQPLPAPAPAPVTTSSVGSN